MSLVGEEPVLRGPSTVWVAGRPAGGRDALARAWLAGGPSAIADWPGDWAVVARRTGEDRLWVAVDAFGGQPLFVRGREATTDLGRVDWRSELDEVELHQHLQARFPEPWRTWWRGVWRVPAGHGGALGGPRDLVRHYRPVARPAPLRHALQGAVERRLGGGELALAFSGGLDSSVLAACLRPARPRLLSVGFPGWAADEGEVARDVASSLGLVRSEVDGRGLDPFAVYPHLGPFPPVLVNHHLLLALMAPGRTLFTGFGGDEVVGHGFGAVAERMAEGRRLRGLATAAGLGLRFRHARRSRVAELRRWTTEVVRHAVRPPDLRALRAVRHLWSVDPLLVRSREEQLQLARSVGTRLEMPFLDPEVASSVVLLPESARVERGRTRRPLREAFRGEIPATVQRRTTKADLSRSLSEGFLEGLEHRRGWLRSARFRGFVGRDRVGAALRRAAWGDPTAEAWLWRAVGAAGFLMAQ